MATVSLATTEKFTYFRDGQKREDTQWHRIVIWGKTAGVAPRIPDQRQADLRGGRIETKEWTSKEGVKAKSTEIRADKVALLGRGGGGGGGARPSRDRYTDDAGPVDSGHVYAPSDDDIPF